MCKFSRISYNDSHMSNWSSYELTSRLSQLLSAFGYVPFFFFNFWSQEPAASARLEAMLTILGLRRG